MTTPIRVRPLAQGQPTDTLAAIYQRCVLEDAGATHALSADDLARLAKSRGVMVLLAEYSRTVVGVGVLTVPSVVGPEAGAPAWYHRKDVAVLDHLAVEPVLRGMGVGAAMIIAAQERAAEWGQDELAVAVPERMASIVASFTKRGFRAVDACQRDERRRLVLSKRLTADAAAA